MPIENLPRTQYFSGKEHFQKAARANIEFILANEKHLLKVKMGNKYLQAVKDMSKSQNLTDNQISYIESIYEKTMKGAGYGSCNTKHDFVKRW